MTHQFLEDAHRHPLRRHAGAEGVPEVVEPNGANICTAERGLEAFEQLGAVDRVAGLRVREHEIVVSLELRVLEQQFELGRDPARERDAPSRALGLWRTELAADVVAPHADPPRAPVDVSPAQGKQLALAHPGHGGGQVHHALDAAERILGNRTQQRLDLICLEGVQVVA